MGTWNEDMLARLGAIPGADPNATANAAALQAIKDSNAAVQTSNAAVQTSNAAVLAKLPALAGTATVTAQTLAAATAVTVLAANTARLGAIVQNDTGQTVLLRFGATATATAYSVKVLNGAYYELPFRYTGLISAYAAAASASPHLLVTELS